MADRCDALVVGAGVIGLTTAVCLAEAGRRVAIWTASPPQQTTSQAASAMWGGAFLEPVDDVRRWAKVTRDELEALAGVSGTGVRVAYGILAGERSADPPPPQAFPGIEISSHDEVPAGFAAAFRVAVPVLDMPRYLDYLVRRLAEARVEIEVRPVQSLADAAERAPVVVNCAGMGARDLAHDDTLRPIRGQHVVVENPGLGEFFMAEPAGSRWTSFMPHGDQVVCGSVADEDDWRLEPDLAIAEEIMRRCVEIEPRLRDARVIEHRVGLRPTRPAVRCEEESLDDVRCVHSYGHGGSGVALSWGCAREVAAMLA